MTIQVREVNLNTYTCTCASIADIFTDGKMSTVDKSHPGSFAA